MAKYLVTGGGGFIGSHITQRLVEAGHQVRVLDNFSTGRRENIAHLLPQIELYEMDIRNLEQVRQAAAGVDYVYHEAALPSVPRSVADPLSAQQSNEVGTLNVLVASRYAGVKRVIFASSSAVYGDSLTLPKHEEMMYNPLSPYAVNKACGEMYCRNFYRLYGLETVCLRYFNVFGPRQDPTSQYAAVVPIFISGILERRSPTIYGDGEQSRDFTYIKNVVEANLLAAAAPKAAGEIINIACGQRITVNELFRYIRDSIGSDINPIYEAPRPGDIKHSLAAVAKAQTILGYNPQYSLVDGLKETVKWFTEKQS